MTDSRFVIVNQQFEKSHWLIIVDFGFYNSNEHDILEWCKSCDMSMQRYGMILKFEHAEELTQFLLSWN